MYILVLFRRWRLGRVRRWCPQRLVTLCTGRSPSRNLTWSPASAPARSSRPSRFSAMRSRSTPLLRSIAIPGRTWSSSAGRSTFCRPMSRLPPCPGWSASCARAGHGHAPAHCGRQPAGALSARQYDRRGRRRQSGLGCRQRSAARRGQWRRRSRVSHSPGLRPGFPAPFPSARLTARSTSMAASPATSCTAAPRARSGHLPAVWAETYPDLPVPTVRFWVIFNNQLRPLPQVTAPTWPALVARSLEMGTRAATVTAIRHLFTQAEIAQLKRGGDVEVRVVAVPNDFVPPKAGRVHQRDHERAGGPGGTHGSRPSSWRTEAP